MESELKEHRVLPVDLCESDLMNMCGRYHFDDTGLPLLREVYENYFRNAAVSAYFSWSGHIGDKAVVLMTLGEDVDRVQSSLMEEESLSEAYMAECIAMELLMKAYGRGDDFLRERTGLWCGQYEFPGTGRPMEDVAEIVDSFGQEEISYNGAYMLIPKKSVAYIVPLQTKEPEVKRKQSLCAGCNRTDCEKRAGSPKELNYGYRRIFSKGGGKGCGKD